MKDITIAAVSLKSRPAEPQENLERHIPWIKEAKEKGASLVCFPELSITGYCCRYEDIFEASEPLKGESTFKMIEIAKKYNIRIAFGLAELSKNDLVRNSYVIVSPQGYIGHYTKTHIPIDEHSLFTLAHEFSVIDLGEVKVGVNICFDNWFCETGRLSFLNGAEIILAPFWTEEGEGTIHVNSRKAFANFKKLAMKNFPAVCWQNGIYHITINSCGGIHEKGVSYDGAPLILIFNPQGELEIESSPDVIDEQMIVHTLKAEKLYERRSEEHFHPKYRRPEIYRNLSRPV